VVSVATVRAKLILSAVEANLKEFLSRISQEWRSEVTGPFSAPYALIAFGVTVAVLLFTLPDRNGVILTAGLTATLFLAAYVHAVYKVWAKQHAESGDPADEVRSRIWAHD